MRDDLRAYATRARRAYALRGELLEAAIALTVASFRVRHRPFEELAPRLGRQGRRAIVELGDAERVVVRTTEQVIAGICRRLPAPPTCLVQAVAARSLLARRGIPATLYIGVAGSTAEGRMQAHAWLECGDRVVTGRAGFARFKPIVWFG